MLVEFIFRCVSEFTQFTKRLCCDSLDDAGDDLNGVQSEGEQPSDLAADVELKLSSRQTDAYKRFDKKMQTVWLTLMEHEDCLSRKITVNTNFLICFKIIKQLDHLCKIKVLFVEVLG